MRPGGFERISRAVGACDDASPRIERIGIMAKLLSSFGFFGRRTAGKASPTGACDQARRRFRNSMPGELGLCAAARLYGVGR